MTRSADPTLEPHEHQFDPERVAIDAAPKELLIGGRWQGGSRGVFGVEDPATGAVLCQVADAGAEDGLRALGAAHQAFGAWRHVAPRARGDVLRRAHDLIMERRDELALLITLEMGKPLAEARGEVAYAASYLRWYSEEAVRIGGGYAASEDGDGRVLTLRQPVGPCVFVTPWNFPLAMAARKLAPAIAAGCTAVVKPAEQTPLSMLALGSLLQEAGLPPGVVNVVPTSDAAAVAGPLIHDPRTRKLSFTGSTAVGRTLIEQSATQVLRVSMELGGNAPFLVFEDADLELAVEGALVAKMRNAGEACTSANRFLVHESVAHEFAGRMAGRMSALTVGRGTEADADVGPLVDGRQRAKVQGLVDDAVARGATCLTGGRLVKGPGYFFEPTVLVAVPDDARLLTEEIFGPVAPIRTFASEGEAVAEANATEYGLVAYAFTEDLDRAFRVIEALETGMVGLNKGVVSNAGAPFGGVKASGYGREGGAEGLGEYLETKYVAARLGAGAVPPAHTPV